MNNLIKSRFPLKSNNMIEEYLWAIETFEKEIEKGTFELYAGDCYLKDVKDHLIKKDLFFMKHYIKDIENNEYYYLGFDCGGNPVGYIVEFLPRNLNRITKVGTYFNK